MLLRLTPEKRTEIARTMILLGLFAAAGLNILHKSLVGDPDLWWHLRTGEWILSHHAIPRTDPFSSYGAGKFWAAYSWLYDVLLFRLYLQWNIAGTLVYTVGMITAITAALFCAIRRQTPDFVLAVLLTIGAIVALLPLFTPRPWLFSVLLYIFEIDILMHARRTGDRGGLYLLPLLFTVWANTHIEFVVGLVMLGLTALEPLAERWWPQRNTQIRSITIWPVFGACVAATLINPYGWRIYQAAYQLADMPVTANLISEMNALPFRSLSDFLLLFLTLFTVAALGWKRRAAFFECVALALAIVSAFHSQRELYLVAVLCFVVLAATLPALEQASGQPRALAMPAIAVVSGVMVWLAAMSLHIDNARLRDDLAQHMPVRAVEAIRAGHYHGPLYNTFDWGGYLIWDLRTPVSVDGRAGVYGDQRLARNVATWSASPDWRSDSDLASAGIVIGARNLPLIQVLRLDPRFALVYEDHTAAVFVQKALQ